MPWLDDLREPDWPVPVVVPCHRVIGADGSLTGYYGGLERKKTLLDLEGGVATIV